MEVVAVETVNEEYNLTLSQIFKRITRLATNETVALSSCDCTFLSVIPDSDSREYGTATTYVTCSYRDRCCYLWTRQAVAVSVAWLRSKRRKQSSYFSFARLAKKNAKCEPRFHPTVYLSLACFKTEILSAIGFPKRARRKEQTNLKLVICIYLKLLNFQI